MNIALLKKQKTISTRQFLSNFSKLTTGNDKDNPMFFIVVKNGMESGIFIPRHKFDEFFNVCSGMNFYSKEKVKGKKIVSLKDSYKKTKFSKKGITSQNYKKLIYS